jgi:DNA-binding HxlR family transcriptional regulator
MLKKFFQSKTSTDTEIIVTAVVSQTSALIHDLHRQMDLRFKELSAQVKEIELGLYQMEKKLLTKDLKDQQNYGLLHYKLHEIKKQKPIDEDEDTSRSIVVE